jgi:hypothetical protein
MLSAEQYKELCIDAMKINSKVLGFIDKAALNSGLYFEICREMLAAAEEVKLDRCFMQIQSKLLSAEQYYGLVEFFLKLLPKEGLVLSFQIFDAKKLNSERYFTICKKLLQRNIGEFASIQSNLLTKTQYANLCFMAVRKGYISITDIDKKRLEKKDWLELCKSSIKKYARYFYLIDICPGKDFGELHSYALRHGAGLKYIAVQRYTQCLAVIKKNGWELRYVEPGNFYPEQYFAICKTAIEKDKNSFRHVDDEALDPKQYQELCAIAVEAFHGNIRFINHDKIPPRLYHQWCSKAVNIGSSWIEYVPFSEKYFDLCLKAVKKDGKSLKHIKYLRLSPEQYQIICKAAVKQTKEAEKFVLNP